MGWVTDVLVICSLSECLSGRGLVPASQTPPPPIAALNDWLRANDHGELRCLDRYATGGGKAFQAVVFGGAFDHFPVQEFFEVFTSLNWAAPDSVQLLVKDEEEVAFTLHRLGGPVGD